MRHLNLLLLALLVTFIGCGNPVNSIEPIEIEIKEDIKPKQQFIYYEFTFKFNENDEGRTQCIEYIISGTLEEQKVAKSKILAIYNPEDVQPHDGPCKRNISCYNEKKVSSFGDNIRENFWHDVPVELLELQCKGEIIQGPDYID